MANAQFQFQVNGGGYGTAGEQVVAAAGDTIDARLADAEGAVRVEWSFHGSHSASAVYPTITLSGIPTGQIATFTLPAGQGQAWGLTCKVNGGANSTKNAALTSKSAVRVPFAHGDLARLPVFINETSEEDSTHNSVPKLNTMLAATAAGSNDPNAIHDNVDGEIAAVTAKAVPVGADLLLLEDSQANNSKRRATLTSIVALAAGGGAVDSVFSRTGVVTAQAGDYNTAQVTNGSSIPGATLQDALNNLLGSNYAIWSPGVTDAPPIYGTLAAALAAVKDVPGPGAVLMHPTTGATFLTDVGANECESRISIYSVNDRTLQVASGGFVENAPEIRCLVDGYTLTVSDGGGGSGTYITYCTDLSLQPLIQNVTKAGTTRRLFGWGAGTPATQRTVIIGRNVTTARSGDIESDGALNVVLRGHGQSFVADSIRDFTGASGQNLTITFEDAQDFEFDTLANGWGTGSTIAAYPQHVFHQQGHTRGVALSTSSFVYSTSSNNDWVKAGNTTSFEGNGMSDGSVSNRIVNDGPTAKFRFDAFANWSADAVSQGEQVGISFGVNGFLLGATDAYVRIPDTAGEVVSVTTFIETTLISGQYVEMYYKAPGSHGRTIERMVLTAKRLE